MSSISITWLGHATFIITTPGGKRIVTDPWLEGNPVCPPDMKKIDKADVILLSHGHFDHTGDIVNVSRAFPRSSAQNAMRPHRADRRDRPR